MLMFRQRSLRAFAGLAAVLLAAGAALLFQAPTRAQQGEPIKIGFGMALTGPLAPNGKSALLAINIWEEDVNAKGAGFKIVYDRNSPPATTDFAPIVRAIQASNAELVLICSYPLDSVGMVRAANEVGLRPKMMGGGMVGLQATVFKTQLGPLLNGIVNYDFWLPVPKMDFPGVAELMKKYQARAGAEGVDPLGYYMAPWGYAQYQALGQAIEASKSIA